MESRYKVGQKVKVISDSVGNVRPDIVVEVAETDEKEEGWFSDTNGNPFNDRIDELEIVSQPVKTLRDMEIGDIIVDGAGSEFEVLAICGEVFAVKYLSVTSNNFVDWNTFKQAEVYNWKLKGREEIETIEIAGKKYNKQEFEEAIRDLKEIKS